MITRVQLVTALSMAGVGGGIVACSADVATTVPRPSANAAAARDGVTTGGGFDFAALTASAVCTMGGSATQPLVLPAGFGQTIVASEPDFADVPDMSTQNETGRDAGRYFRPTRDTPRPGSRPRCRSERRRQGCFRR